MSTIVKILTIAFFSAVFFFDNTSYLDLDLKTQTFPKGKQIDACQVLESRETIYQTSYWKLSSLQTNWDRHVAFCAELSAKAVVAVCKTADSCLTH